MVSTDEAALSPSYPMTSVAQGERRFPLVYFLVLTLLFPVAVIIGNFVIAILTPITWAPDDEMELLDPVWRLVQGQHLGTDFHDPIGFGYFEVAAMVWRLLGPHYYVLRVATDLFALVIAICCCFVAVRRLRHLPGIAALFCIVVALIASGPSNFGMPADFGIALAYDRLLVASLAVLFVHGLANNSDFRQENGYVDLCFVAFLLNILFLVKITGLVLGLAIVAGGLLLHGHLMRGLVKFSLILLFLAIMVAIDFVITGASILAVIHEYRMVAQARTGVYSVFDLLWYASRPLVLGTVALLALYAVSGPLRKENGSLWSCFAIIAIYWACQVALNMSNGVEPRYGPYLIHLAPIAAVAIVTWTDPTDYTVAFWDRLWTRVRPQMLDEISLRRIIPLLLFVLIMAPEALASLRAVKLDYSISSGTVTPIAVTANRGVTFWILPTHLSNVRYALSYGDAIQAIDGLAASGYAIANLDFMNPFPALFLAPAPRGVSVFWDFSQYTSNVPAGYRLRWQEIIGDACIVTEPLSTELPTTHSRPLIDAVQAHLTSTFTLVFHDELWRIWKSRNGCNALGRAIPILAREPG